MEFCSSCWIYWAILIICYLVSQARTQEPFITRTNNVTGERVRDGSLFDLSQLDFSLFCWVRTVNNRIPPVYWSINNQYESNGSKLSEVNIGWKVYDDLQLPYTNEELYRSQTTAAVEGNLRCTTQGSDRPITYVQVGIYYPILSISINKIDYNNGTHQISCTSAGGRPVRMSVSGPSGVVEDNMNIVNVGRAVGTGYDSFTSNTTVHNGRNGDTYTCFATNGISNMSNSMTLGDVPSSNPNQPVNTATPPPLGNFMTSSTTISTEDSSDPIVIIISGALGFLVLVLSVCAAGVAFVILWRKHSKSDRKGKYPSATNCIPPSSPETEPQYSTITTVVRLSHSQQSDDENKMAGFQEVTKENGIEPEMSKNTTFPILNNGTAMYTEISVPKHIEEPEFKNCLHFEPVPRRHFEEHVATYHSMDNRFFKQQYIVLESDQNMPPMTNQNRSTKKLNRYGNIAPYDHNRVILGSLGTHPECQRDYINASYVDGYRLKDKFIATQGPIPSTVVDFWRMVWQERAHTIVMLANLVEGSAIKCHKYWPEDGSMVIGPFIIIITEQQILADYTTREFYVEVAGSNEPALNVTQFHFTAWPDHGVPDYATSLLAFHKKVKKYHRPSKGPIITHCSAGVGRTGTLIAIDCVLDQLEEEKMVDIAGVIIHLRTQRMKMVQSLEQYMFVHDAILEALTCGDTQIDSEIFSKRIKEMNNRNPQTQLTEYENQFKILEKVSPNPREIPRADALRYPAKNRSDSYLPGDMWRVRLHGDREDYIHGVFVNGYKQQMMFIVAQSPMESTARDFWKMVHDNKCGVIVMLCNLVEDGQEVCYRYWPDSGKMEFREFTVKLQEVEEKEGFALCTLVVMNLKTGSVHQVVQLHVTGWSPDGSCANLATITKVLNETLAIQRRTGNRAITVHCSDTVGRSGMFCAIATTIERCKTEGVVDVFQVVKALRIQKPGAVLNVTQYHILFEAVLEYLSTFDTYWNFKNPSKVNEAQVNPVYEHLPI